MKTVNSFIGRLVLLLVFLSTKSVASSQPVPPTNYVLVVTDLISFTGKWKDNNVSLECKLAQDHSITKIYVERSVGHGGQFVRIAEINPAGRTGFSYVDPIIPESNNLYRIVLYKRDNNYAYSKTLKFDSKTTVSLALQVYPTVVTGSATMSVSSAKAGKGTLQIADMNGQTLSSRQLSIQQGTTVTDLDNVNTLTPGHYMVVLQTDSERQVQRIIVQ